jgi:hypothetical protein
MGGTMPKSLVIPQLKQVGIEVTTMHCSFLAIALTLAIGPAATLAADDSSSSDEQADVLKPGQTSKIPFADADLPPTLYSALHGENIQPVVTVRLPDDYDASRSYPVVVYVPGNDGGEKGNFYNAETIAGRRGWIAATLPLFQKAIDRSERSGGVIVSFEDYPVLSRAYATMLGRLFERIPNIDRQRSAMVGFSNGAITIGVLVSNHDEFILTRFRNFCLVDQGMFHLADLHKSRAKGCRFLILVGDRPGFGREQRIRQSELLEESWKLLDVDLTHRTMVNTGHEFNDPQMALVRNWLRGENLNANSTVAPTPRPKEH